MPNIKPFLLIIFAWACINTNVKAQTTNKSQHNQSDSNWSLPYHWATYTFTTNVQNAHPKKIHIRTIKIIMHDKTETSYSASFYVKEYDYRDLEMMPATRWIAQLFGKTTVDINKNGTIIDIDSTEWNKLKDKWGKTKQRIEKYYTGAGITTYVSTVNTTINNKRQLMSFFERDEMYGLWLKSIAVYAQAASKTKKSNTITTLKLKEKNYTAVFNYNEEGILLNAYAKQKATSRKEKDLVYEIKNIALNNPN